MTCIECNNEEQCYICERKLCDCSDGDTCDCCHHPFCENCVRIMQLKNLGSFGDACICVCVKTCKSGKKRICKTKEEMRKILGFPEYHKKST